MEDINHLLLQALSDGLPFRDMLDRCSAIMGNPVRFTVAEQPEQGYMSADYPMEDYLEWKHYCIVNGEIITPYRQFLGEDYGLDHQNKPFIHDLNGLITKRRIICITYIGGNRIGHLSLPEMDKPLESFDSETVSSCAHAVALSWLLSGEAKKNRFSQDEPRRLFRGRIRRYEDLTPRNRRDWPEKGEYRLLLLLSGSESSGFPFSAVCSALADRFRTPWLLKEDKQALLLIRNSIPFTYSAEQCTQFFQQEHCACCVSPSFDHLLDASRWAKRLSLLNQLLQIREGNVVCAQDHLEFLLYAETELTREAYSDFIHPSVRHMEIYDRENQTSFLETLSCYAVHGMNRRRTAAALFLHENTVAYRLRQIHTLFGIDSLEICAYPEILHSLRLLAFFAVKEKQDSHDYS